MAAASHLYVFPTRLFAIINNLINDFLRIDFDGDDGLAIVSKRKWYTSFSGDGLVAIDLGTDESGQAVAIQSDGMIVVAGFFYTGSGFDADFAVVRHEATVTDSGGYPNLIDWNIPTLKDIIRYRFFD